MSGKCKIEIRGVEKSFGANHVLRGVDLKIGEGEITVIIGRSGEGKSVLLKHIIGLLRPDGGEILIDGENIAALRGAELNRMRAKFGMLFQGGALFDSMTVEIIFLFPCGSTLASRGRKSPRGSASRSTSWASTA